MTTHPAVAQGHDDPRVLVLNVTGLVRHARRKCANWSPPARLQEYPPWAGPVASDFRPKKRYAPTRVIQRAEVTHY